MFHNDLKRDNVMQKNGLPILIDFDLAHASKIRIAVSAGATLDFDFESHGLAIPAMRTYYDLFYYTMSIPASHPWYASIFLTLHDLFIELQPLFERLLAELSEKARTDIPLEVLVREESVKKSLGIKPSPLPPESCFFEKNCLKTIGGTSPYNVICRKANTFHSNAKW